MGVLMDELNFNNIELNDHEKKVLEEIRKLTETNCIGEAIKCIDHAVNGYLQKIIIEVENLQNGIFGNPEKQKEVFAKIIQNSVKASLAAKELRKFYHL
jgi:hypothetical protein